MKCKYRSLVIKNNSDLIKYLLISNLMYLLRHHFNFIRVWIWLDSSNNLKFNKLVHPIDIWYRVIHPIKAIIFIVIAIIGKPQPLGRFSMDLHGVKSFFVRKKISLQEHWMLGCPIIKLNMNDSEWLKYHKNQRRNILEWIKIEVFFKKVKKEGVDIVTYAR